MGFPAASIYLVVRPPGRRTAQPRKPPGPRGALEHQPVMNRVISALCRLLGPSVRGSFSRSPCNSGGSVLLASERDDDYQTLQTHLQNTKWSVVQALSLSVAAKFCDGAVSPVVLVDRHFQRTNWRATVSLLLNLRAANPCLILLSDVLDPYLWSEVIKLGGFDVLARPLECNEVLRTLAFAQTHCEADWPRLHVPPRDAAVPGWKI